MFLVLVTVWDSKGRVEDLDCRGDKCQVGGHGSNELNILNVY